MDKSTLLLLAIVLAVFGGSVVAGHPAWGTFMGVAIILLAVGLAAGSLPLNSPDYADERSAPSRRISNGLVGLSSAAIVAIYAAGYHRTAPAARKFDSQTPHERASAAAVLPPPTAANSQNAVSAPTATPAPPPNKKSNARPAAPRKAPVKAPEPGISPRTQADAIPAQPEPAPPQQAQYKDGVYMGWGSCRHGDIQASVTIQNGKIATVMISQCLTRYSCAWIAPKDTGGALPNLPVQVVERQSAKVDYVSGATESSYAFADAVTAALSKATE